MFKFLGLLLFVLRNENRCCQESNPGLKLSVTDYLRAGHCTTTPCSLCYFTVLHDYLSNACLPVKKLC